MRVRGRRQFSLPELESRLRKEKLERDVGLERKYLYILEGDHDIHKVGITQRLYSRMLDFACKPLGFNPYRQELVEGLLAALRNLRNAGCRSVLIDGSFVSSKPFPGDYDGAWDPTGVNPERVDPILLTFDNKRAAMKAKYLGELFPATALAAPGIRFAEFFQQDRDGNPKGVVRLALESLP